MTLVGELMTGLVTGGSSNTPEWVTIVTVLVAALVGTGGVSALIKARSDKKLGIAASERAEQDAVNNRWLAIIEAQTKSLLEPLQAALAATRAELESHKLSSKEEIAALNRKLEERTKKYWSAISHIRTLYTWIGRHMGDSVENTAVPEPPATIMEDI